MTQRKEHKLPRRDAELAKYIAFRNRQDGDQTVKGCSIRFANLMLSQAELADLMQEPLAGRALFCKRPGTVLDEPLFRTIGAIPLTTHLTGRAFLYSTLGTDEIDLGLVSVTNVKLEPKAGGLTAMAGVIQATPVLDSRVAEFIDRMGTNVQLEVTYEHEGEQQDLPLENGSTPGYEQRGSTTDSNGEQHELRSGAEIDAEMHARSPNGETMGEAAKGSSPDPEFEAAAKAQVAAFKRGRAKKASGKGAH